MEDAAEISRLLDILGNRNRRRIIELLRQKPCFVTEISDTLMISPKAVIDHLQMMEREAILSCQTDDRRRKYYYLDNDIIVDVSLRRQIQVVTSASDRQGETESIQSSVRMFGQMIKAHDVILSSLEQINHDIETKINDLAQNHKDLFTGEREITIIIALSHDSLTFDELEQVTGISRKELGGILKRFGHKGIIERTKDQFTLRGIHAE